MYLNNKYTKWYNNIISKASIRVNVGYVERHHIIPVSLGGSKTSKKNIVALSAREHFICHLLLTKMVTGQSLFRMNKALTMFMSTHKKNRSGCTEINSRWYAYLKETNKLRLNEFWTPEKRQEHSIKLKEYNKSLDTSSEKETNRRKKLRESQLNKTWTEKALQTRSENMRLSAENRKGKPWSDNRLKAYLKNPPTQQAESNRKRSEALKGRKTSIGNLGHRQSEETKLKKLMSDSRTMAVWFRSPEDKEILCLGINRFSKANGLNVGMIRTMIGNTEKEYKGWRFVRLATQEERGIQNH